MKKRILPIIASALVFLMLFTGCSGNKKSETDVSEESTAQIQEETTEDVTDSAEPEETVHTVFGRFESVTSEGEKIDYTVFEGKLTMVVLWSIVSEPGISQMPVYEKLSKEYADRNLQVVGIADDVYMYEDGSFDQESLAQTKSIIENADVSYVNILPSQSLIDAKLDEAKISPEIIFLDEKGNQIGESFIGSRSYDEWCYIVDSVLESAE